MHVCVWVGVDGRAGERGCVGVGMRVCVRVWVGACVCGWVQQCTWTSVLYVCVSVK